MHLKLIFRLFHPFGVFNYEFLLAYGVTSRQHGNITNKSWTVFFPTSQVECTEMENAITAPPTFWSSEKLSNKKNPQIVDKVRISLFNLV